MVMNIVVAFLIEAASPFQLRNRSQIVGRPACINEAHGMSAVRGCQEKCSRVKCSRFKPPFKCPLPQLLRNFWSRSGARFESHLAGMVGLPSLCVGAVGGGSQEGGPLQRSSSKLRCGPDHIPVHPCELCAPNRSA